MSDKSLSFLYEATKIVPKNPCGTFIRSQLLSKCHSLTAVNLPAQNFKTSVMCQGCGIELAEVPPRTTLKKAPKPTKLIKRIKNALQKNDVRPKVPKHYLNIYNAFIKNNHQRLITKCQLCTKKNVINITKPNIEPPTMIIPQPISKKKRKDLFAGLKKSAVLSVSTPPKLKVKTINTNTEFIPLDTNKSIVVSVNSSEDRNVSLVTKANVVPLVTNNSAVNKSIQSNNNNKSKSKKNKKKNKVKSGRVQKNEVLQQTQKNPNAKKKNDKKLKNLTNMLNLKNNPSNSLANFLQNL